MFGKIFESMFDGTMHGHWQAIVTLQQMIVLADQDGTVDMTPEALSARTSIPLEIITTGIAELEQPDPKSRTPDEDGRRIVRLDPSRDWGWRITNYLAYRAIRSAEERREYMRQYQRDRRSARASTVSTGRKQVLANVSPRTASASSSSLGDRGVGKGDAADELVQLRSRYTPAQLTVIDAAIADFARCRKGGKIADGKVAKLYGYWSRFPPEQVVAGLRTYVEKGYADGPKPKDERYANGVIRNTDPVDADLEDASDFRASAERRPRDNYLTPDQVREAGRG